MAVDLGLVQFRTVWAETQKTVFMMGEWRELLDQKMVERFWRETQRTEKGRVGAKTDCS